MNVWPIDRLGLPRVKRSHTFLRWQRRQLARECYQAGLRREQICLWFAGYPKRRAAMSGLGRGPPLPIPMNDRLLVALRTPERLFRFPPRWVESGHRTIPRSRLLMCRKQAWPAELRRAGAFSGPAALAVRLPATPAPFVARDGLSRLTSDPTEVPYVPVRSCATMTEAVVVPLHRNHVAPGMLSVMVLGPCAVRSVQDGCRQL